MIQLGTEVLHIVSQRKCFIIYINNKEPKYKVRFPDMYVTDVYTTELAEIGKEEPLLASEPVLDEILLGEENLQIESKTTIKETVSSNEEIKVNKEIKK